MDASILLIWQNWHEDLSDEEFYRKELQIGEMAETLGYDSIWSVEHHFRSYGMCPDNVAVLAYLAARTETISLGTGAVILPWNDPLRVAEKVTILDHLAGGRVKFGIGRGLSRREYSRFGIDMGESRDRFTESAAMIRQALETGVIQGDGPYYPQAETEIRPRPRGSFADRTWSVAMSQDSADAAADMGVGMLAFVQGPIEQHAPMIESYREQYRAKHGTEAPPPLLALMTYCHEDPDVAEEHAKRWMSQVFLAVVDHYEFTGTHFDETPGYQSYGEGARLIREAGLEAVTENYISGQLWGTPEQIVAQLAHIKDALGECEPCMIFSYGGLPFDLAEESYKLFSKEVLPELRKI
jgi:alkanesulfonate monooxygenase SsuD/methylene tetrahydromethanopterin reductase-like flavin-dependent oxidoreductase (luciferase family)